MAGQSWGMFGNVWKCLEMSGKFRVLAGPLAGGPRMCFFESSVITARSRSRTLASSSGTTTTGSESASRRSSTDSTRSSARLRCRIPRARCVLHDLCPPHALLLPPRSVLPHALLLFQLSRTPLMVAGNRADRVARIPPVRRDPWRSVGVSRTASLRIRRPIRRSASSWTWT